MVKFTISGLPGSGTSTLVGTLCDELGYTSLNGGDVFRDEAANRGLSVASFSELCISNSTVDRALDQRLVESMNDPQGPDIVESRLAGWWAYREGIKCHRIWIEVDLEERLRRVALREGDDLQRRQESMIREEADRQRYSELYGIDILSMEPYTLVIDASMLNAEEVHSAVQQGLNI
jgi:cytidylate kinase